MTKYYSVNKQYAIGDGVGCVYDLVNTLVSASWTIQSASNGTNFDAGTTYWSPTSLAGTRAWVTVREPSGPGGREWCFQKTTASPNNYTWRIKVSPSVGFTGSADATTVPTASDEAQIWGVASPDSAPVGDVLFYPSTYATKFHIVAESSPVGPAGNQAYGWWAFSNLAGAMGDYVYTFIGQEPLAVGSYPALVGTRASTTTGDADPCIYGCYYDSNANYSVFNYVHGLNNGGRGTFVYFYQYQNASGSLANAVDLILSPGYYAGSSKFVNANPCSGEDTNFPFIVGRTAVGSGFYVAPSSLSTQIGLKGTCNFLKIRGTARNTGITVDLSTDAYIYLGDLLMPWPENIPPEF